VRLRAAAFLLAFLAACGATSKRREEELKRPDGAALSVETVVQARRAEIVLAARWRPEAKVEAIRVEDEGPDVQLLRGGVVFTLRGLRLEVEELRIRWLAETEDLFLYASTVERFWQRRGQPYESKGLAALSMANDHVTFIQQ